MPHGDHLVITFTDVTDLRRAEERVRSVLQSITDSFYAVDRNWNITYINRRAAG